MSVLNGFSLRRFRSLSILNFDGLYNGGFLLSFNLLDLWVISHIGQWTLMDILWTCPLSMSVSCIYHLMTSLLNCLYWWIYITTSFPMNVSVEGDFINFVYKRFKSQHLPFMNHSTFYIITCVYTITQIKGFIKKAYLYKIAIINLLKILTTFRFNLLSVIEIVFFFFIASRLNLFLAVIFMHRYITMGGGGVSPVI
jgi:hypothetical protein